jgi:hypothetical protein
MYGLAIYVCIIKREIKTFLKAVCCISAGFPLKYFSKRKQVLKT